MTLVQLLSALISAGVVGSIIAAFAQRRKVKADAIEAIQRASSSMIERLEKEIEELRSRMDKMQERIDHEVDLRRAAESRVRHAEERAAHAYRDLADVAKMLVSEVNQVAAADLLAPVAPLPIEGTVEPEGELAP